MKDESQFIDRVRGELDRQLDLQPLLVQARLRAARRDALDSANLHARQRRWVPALAASLFVVVATSVIWFEVKHSAEDELARFIQTASVADRQLLEQGDEIELYQDLEFYYWLEQEQGHAG